MTTLHLVRHGPTHAKTMIGWSDIPADLSDRAKLAALRDALPGEFIAVSSDLLRAKETLAELVADGKSLPPDPRLREIHFGDWEGLRFDEAEAKTPDLLRQFWENPGLVSAPNGESWNECSARVSEAIDEIIDAHNGREIVVVAHYGAILTQLARALNISAASAFAFEIDNLSVSTIVRHEDKEGPRENWRVVRVNHVSPT